MWTLIRKSSEEPPPNVGVLLMKKLTKSWPHDSKMPITQTPGKRVRHYGFFTERSNFRAHNQAWSADRLRVSFGDD